MFDHDVVMPSSHHDDPPKHIEISLRIAFNGVVKPIEHIERAALVQSVLDRALALFHVTDRPHAQGLFREDGTEVPPTQSVEQAKLVEDQLLVLRARTPQGG